MVDQRTSSRRFASELPHRLQVAVVTAFTSGHPHPGARDAPERGIVGVDRRHGRSFLSGVGAPTPAPFVGEGSAREAPEEVSAAATCCRCAGSEGTPRGFNSRRLHLHSQTLQPPDTRLGSVFRVEGTRLSAFEALVGAAPDRDVSAATATSARVECLSAASMARRALLLTAAALVVLA